MNKIMSKVRYPCPTEKSNKTINKMVHCILNQIKLFKNNSSMKKLHNSI
jgi:hypothetical protein